jgi:hypothetical protein
MDAQGFAWTNPKRASEPIAGAFKVAPWTDSAEFFRIRARRNFEELAFGLPLPRIGQGQFPGPQKILQKIHFFCCIPLCAGYYPRLDVLSPFSHHFLWG